MINQRWTSLYRMALGNHFLVKGLSDVDGSNLGQIQKVSCAAVQMIGRLSSIVAITEFVFNHGHYMIGQANDGLIKVMLDKVRVNVGEGGGDKGSRYPLLLPLLCRGRGSRRYFYSVLSMKSQCIGQANRASGQANEAGYLVRLTGVFGQANDGIWSG